MINEEVNEKDLPQEKKDQFDMDVAVLRCFYTLTAIAKAMEMEDSNLSNYLKKQKNRKFPVTQNILDLLHNTWGAKLKEIYTNRIIAFERDISAQSIVGEETQNGTKKGYGDRPQDNLDIVIKSNQELVRTNSKLVTTNQKLIDAHLNSGGRPKEP